MEKSLRREFFIEASRDAFFAVAKEPLLGPCYLNFLTRIEPLEDVCFEDDVHVWQRFQVWVNYRSVLKSQSIVAYRVDSLSKAIFLRHNGQLAAFEAQFDIKPGRVGLGCVYRAKTTLMSWLIASALDRALSQASRAMDRYAAAIDLAPT
jgi:hypothetical protein